MVERICHVCGAPAEPGAERCVNCGTSLEPAREPVRPSGVKSSSSVAALVGLAVVIGGGAAVAFFTISMNTEKDFEETRTATEPAQASDVREAVKPSPAAELPVETQEEIEALEQLRKAQQALRDLAGEEVPTEDESATGSDESVTLHFGARVASAKGKALAKGKSCDVNVHARGSSIQHLDVSCGDVVLYDSRTPLNGMSSYGGEIFERAKGNGWVYRVAYTDVGMRTSRSQLRLNSLSGEGTAFSQGSDAFQVALTLNEFSAPRVGASLLGTLPPPGGLTLNLQVRDKSGEPPTLASGGCKLTSSFIENSDTGAVCKTELHCGKQTYYGKGQSGYGPCEFEGASITRFVDEKETHEDGDPRLVLDVAEGSVELRDSPSQKAYSVTFEITR